MTCPRCRPQRDSILPISRAASRRPASAGLKMSLRAALNALFVGAMLLVPAAGIAGATKTPVIFDTDIGTDIDDAYALATLLHHPEFELLGVITVSGDAVARARLAAKRLQVAGRDWRRVPVYAGTSTATQYMQQVDWASGFSSPRLHASG